MFISSSAKHVTVNTSSSHRPTQTTAHTPNLLQTDAVGYSSLQIGPISQGSAAHSPLKHLSSSVSDESNRCPNFHRPFTSWSHIVLDCTYGFADGCEGFERLLTFGGWLFFQYLRKYVSICVSQQPNSGTNRLTFEIFRSHTIRHTQ
jgi:hypothetical protein